MRSNRTLAIHVTRILEGGVCPHGHRVGDIFYLCGGRTEGMCPVAAGALGRFMKSAANAGCCPDSDSKGFAEVCCPSPAHPVVFALRQMELGDSDWMRTNFPLRIVYSQDAAHRITESALQWKSHLGRCFCSVTDPHVRRPAPPWAPNQRPSARIRWHCPSFRQAGLRGL